MTQATSPIRPLRQCMFDDTRMRKLALKTQSNYLRAVQRFAGFLGRAPSRVTEEELRQFQLSLVDAGLSPTALNGTLSGLKFFLEVTLDRAALARKLRPVRVPRTLRGTPPFQMPQEAPPLGIPTAGRCNEVRFGPCATLSPLERTVSACARH